MSNSQHSTLPHDAEKVQTHSDTAADEKQTTTLTDYSGANNGMKGEDLAGGQVDEAYRVAGQTAIAFSDDESRAVRRKIDKRIPVLCAAIYFCQYLDKTLLNYASITGLPIVGQQYNQVSAA
jgi:hypothetical protein